jgi:hypothetical protein
MSQTIYDPQNWLVTMTRGLEDYAKAAFNGDLYTVQMSYPDVANLTNGQPLDKVLIHFERDVVDSPVWAFGIQGVDEWSDPSHLSGMFMVHEAQRVIVNYDVGVWASADAGGETYRMLAVQTLHNIFGPAGVRQNFNALTQGITIGSFTGGRDTTDRINDLPVWRTMDMTLVLEAFSRGPDPAPDVVPEDFDILGTLDITP